MSKYLFHLAVAFDQLFNAVLGGAADETLSSRTYRGAVLSAEPKKRWRVLHKIINGLFFWEKIIVKVHTTVRYYVVNTLKHFKILNKET
ncbi:hypothetical protein AAUPMB_20080 [Pasteurella multocida subsp. multocida str. Anand1_buffalo]|nr:hypothetical protein AAUPMB_20080 [Pasteurella multocida subsp. multocida str. Anand1_buffalo]